ncbi:helix-turn-helix domain-containing protein [Achromobacter sp. MY14]|uniref:helix-turn-helix domain-containing protein n=1 Tax=unclassified Achromobacter TaxID=2626865 RepID=UPI001E32D62A|nr:helix-turn-helix domain-containing protein [Achromobacter sp. MY14]MCD0501243.1 helix-turn-helix domain-containing protein [Achromobacter sp. MY14]
MNWKKLIQDLVARGMTQSQIAAEVGLKQSTVAGILAGGQKDMKWHNGEKLRALHSRICEKDQSAK